MSYLNEIAPEIPRQTKKRVGRGIGSGKGKTCGRGHKGQKARSGGYHKVGFEGGQMPIQRRLPKYGFTSRKSLCREDLRSSVLDQIQTEEVVTIEVLRALGLIRFNTKHVKIFSQGEVTKAIKLKNIRVTKSVKDAIEKAGGSVE